MNKKNWTLVILAIVVAAMLLACSITINPAAFSNPIRSSGKIVTETRPVSGFSTIQLAGSGQMTLDQGPAESLTIEADENVLPHIITEVNGTTLVIRPEASFNVLSGQTIHYQVVVKDLNGLSSLGSADITTGPISSDHLTVTVAGSGNIQFGPLNGQDVNASILGSGDLKMFGKIVSQAVKILGSGSFNGGDLQSASANVNIAGSGDVTLWVTDSLSATILGSGNVLYYGSPALSSSTIGSGDLKPLGEHK